MMRKLTPMSEAVAVGCAAVDAALGGPSSSAGLSKTSSSLRPSSAFPRRALATSLMSFGAVSSSLRSSSSSLCWAGDDSMFFISPQMTCSPGQHLESSLGLAVLTICENMRSRMSFWKRRNMKYSTAELSITGQPIIGSHVLFRTQSAVNIASEYPGSHSPHNTPMRVLVHALNPPQFAEEQQSPFWQRWKRTRCPAVAYPQKLDTAEISWRHLPPYGHCCHSMSW